MDPKPKTLKTPKTLETEETPPSPSPSPSHFSFAITKVAVSQICQSIGFKGSKTSALETLTNIATIYLQTLAKSAASIATTSGRTETNLFDLIYGLEDLASVQGFRGASNVDKSLLRSTTLIDIMDFVETTDETPFAKPIPHNKKSDVIARDLEQKSRRRSHIPRWLPPFPDEIRLSKLICRNNSLKRFGSLQNSDICAQNIEQNSGGWSANEIAGRLPTERARVRFKMGEVGEGIGMGVDLRNGVCRGGKRISWRKRVDEQGEEKNNSFKRRR